MKSNKKIIIILSAVLVVLLATFCTVYFLDKAEREKGSSQSSSETGAEAAKAKITFTIVDKGGTKTVYTIETDEKYLAGALIKEGIVPAYSEDGFYSTFGGITADWNVDQGWWCITESGEMLNYGLNEIIIENGDQFEATYTIGF